MASFQVVALCLCPFSKLNSCPSYIFLPNLHPSHGNLSVALQIKLTLQRKGVAETIKIKTLNCFWIYL